MVFKKAQAAMEFLMTYGWAILVVLVVIGALAYFGVLNPTTFVPERCVLSLPIDCRAASMNDDVPANEDDLTLALLNTGTRDIEITELRVKSDRLTTECVETLASPVSLTASGSSVAPTSVVANGCNLVANSNGKKAKFSIEVRYQYTDAAGVTNVNSGEVITTVQ